MSQELLTAAAVRAEMDALRAPLEKRIEQIDARLAELNDERTSLQGLRGDLAKTLAGLDHETREEKRQKNREAAQRSASTKKGSGIYVADETVDEILQLLRSSSNGDEFYAAELARREEFHWTATTLGAAFVILADRGQLRLSSSGVGGRKNYKLVGGNE